MSNHEKTTHAARGKWKGILLSLGVDQKCLTGKHGPCPMCGGEDRFRFDNKEQRGTWICNNCGAGDGMKLAMDYTGRPFYEIASAIDDLVGNVKPDAPSRPAITEEQSRQALRAVWSATQPVRVGDLAHKYLEARHVGELIYPDALRFGDKIKDGEGGIRPCMVAIVSGPDGKPATLHRTFLRPDGLAKADMRSPRKLMPADLPDGACVKTCEYTSGPLGIAEGIETAMAASALWDMPVWAAINAGNLAKWIPPEGCEEVAIFGDNDTSFTGHAVSYTLARKLKSKGLHVTVHIPPIVGDDWADVLAAKYK